MPGYMVRDEDNDPELSNLVIKTNYNRWFKGFKIPEDIRYNDAFYTDFTIFLIIDN